MSNSDYQNTSGIFTQLRQMSFKVNGFANVLFRINVIALNNKIRIAG